MHVIRLQTVDSTNSWISKNEEELKAPVMVSCHTQYSGRGQRGNSWESAPGMNITASVLFKPQNFPASLQFHISEAIALAMVDLLNFYGIKAKIKWPNDIYVGDRKISGILVENMVVGKDIIRTIIGIGLNVNQVEFLSSAPNPVSMKIITGQSYDIEDMELKFADFIEKFLFKLENPSVLHDEFMKHLWRFDSNPHPFYDKNKKESISAYIENVREDGLLTLRLGDGSTREYAFKEVEFIIGNMK